MRLKKNISKRLSGGILLEPLAAIVIISLVMTYATFSMNNIFMGKNSYLKFKALIQLEELMLTNSDTENESYNYNTYSINKEVSTSELAFDIMEITWEIKEAKTNRILGTIKELKRRNEY